MRIDLHVHSDCSDGSMPPRELVHYAKKEGVYAFALTDHDTVAGVADAVEEGKKEGVLVIPGIEVSAGYRGKNIHILGLNLDVTEPAFLAQLEGFRESRNKRNRNMLQKMIDYGLPVDKEDFFQRYPHSVITRAHFGEYLLEAGVVSTIQEAFDRYIGKGKPCYLPKEEVSCQQAIACIKSAKGHPVLAHPYQYKFSTQELEAFIEELVGYGLEGLETIYTGYSEAQERELRGFAAKYGLHITGGSDFHGSKKPDIKIGTGRGSLYVHHDVMNWLL